MLLPFLCERQENRREEVKKKVLKLLLILFLLFSLFILCYNANHPIKLESKININTATIEELNSLPLVGKTKAQYIIEYRITKGKFKSLDELDNVTGIGEKTIQALKYYAEVK
jgi:comEA protein